MPGLLRPMRRVHYKTILLSIGFSVLAYAWFDANGGHRKKKSEISSKVCCCILLSRRETMIGDAAQYQELMTLYGSYGDDELVELGRGKADLTEMAQEVLKGELTRRGLKIAPVGQPVETRVLTEEDLRDMRAYAELAP